MLFPCDWRMLFPSYGYRYMLVCVSVVKKTITTHPLLHPHVVNNACHGSIQDIRWGGGGGGGGRDLEEVQQK